MLITIIAEVLKFVFPAYCANAVPVVLGGGRPIDFGKKFLDEKPIFGAHKTFRGFFAGLIVGSFVGLIESILFPHEVNPWLGFLLSFGALVGDLSGSFLKRRLGYSPGASLLIVDQLSFLFGALLFSVSISPPPLMNTLIAIIITPPIHFLTNFAAYALGLKKGL